MVRPAQSLNTGHRNSILVSTEETKYYLDDKIKSRRMRWVGHVEHMEEMRNAYKILVGKPEGKKHLEDKGVDGRII
jgi:hypothetical protein